MDRLSHALRDRYRIDRSIGRGGMATVFLASDVKHDRQVAIKVLRIAMDWLERAFDARAGAIYGIKGSFLFAPLRDHPRFVALLRRMNLA